jgi:polyhydroxyalkanoate synthase
MDLWNLLTLPLRFKRRAEDVGSTPSDVVHRENQWRLLRYRPTDGGPEHRTPLVIVPSLINRHYVLDLLPDRSFVGWMVERGHDVYMIDWGTPGDENRHLDFDTICDTYLGRARRIAARRSGVDRAHLMGYCLGGTLTAIHAAAYPDEVAAHVALAAPVAFEDDGLLTTWMNNPTFDVDSLVDATRNVPWPLMQFAFHMLEPTLNAKKAKYALENSDDASFLDGFAALEIWGNDNVSFPGEAFRDYIQRLYQENRLVEDEFALSGRRVYLEDADHPTLVISFEHDHIVPPESAEPLADCVGTEDCEHLHLPGGHVTSVTSTSSKEALWPQISNWLVERDRQGVVTTDDREALAAE